MVAGQYISTLLENQEATCFHYNTNGQMLCS